MRLILIFIIFIFILVSCGKKSEPKYQKSIKISELLVNLNV